MQSRKAFNNDDSRKTVTTKQSSRRPKPYDRLQQVHSVCHFGTHQQLEEWPRLATQAYWICFTVNAPAIVSTLHSLGNTVKWSFMNEKAAPRRVKSKWCAFHCISLVGLGQILCPKPAISGQNSGLFGPKSVSACPNPVPKSKNLGRARSRAKKFCPRPIKKNSGRVPGQAHLISSKEGLILIS